MSTVWNALGAGIARGLEAWRANKREKEEKEKWNIENKRKQEEHTLSMESLKEQLNALRNENKRLREYYAKPETITRPIMGAAGIGALPSSYSSTTPGGVGYQLEQLSVQQAKQNLEPEKPDLYETVNIDNFDILKYKSDGTLKTQDEIMNEYNQRVRQSNLARLNELKVSRSGGKEKEEALTLFNPDNSVNIGAVLNIMRQMSDANILMSTPEGLWQLATNIAGIDNRSDEASIKAIHDALVTQMGISEQLSEEEAKQKQADEEAKQAKEKEAELQGKAKKKEKQGEISIKAAKKYGGQLMNISPGG